MAQPAPQRSPLAAPVIITVQNGQVPGQTSIPSSGQAQFNNLDNATYLIELWTKKNDHSPALCVVLPANGSVTLQGSPDADDQNTHCNYHLMTPSGGATNPAAGGGGVIIIGSGPEGGKR
jgi:hypothetical protein